MEQLQLHQNLNIYSSCRTCLENLNDMEIYYDIFGIPDLQEKLTACSSLPVELEDGLPTSLCESCLNKINDFYIFQRMCISARKRFQDYMSSERKPCSMELASHSNNPTDFMIFTVAKKEFEDDEDPLSPSSNVQDQTESSTNEADKSDESPSPNGEYNMNLNRSITKENNGTFICHKRPNAHSTKQSIQCEICKKCFKKIETYEVHMRLHKGLKPFPCQLCDKSYARRERLKLHIKAYHEQRPDESFPCTEMGCDKKLSSKQTLRQHIRDIHWKNSKKPKQRYICEECGKVQTGLNALKNHRYLHTGQQLPHECPQCHKRFITKNILKEHINRHDGIKNYICPHCGTKRTTRMDLQRHINSHTKEKKYPCHICDMVYYNVYNLNRHKRIIHEGMKDFQCSYCDKSFGRAETRKHHEMTHTGERPHECNICHKKFIQIISLKKHQNVHSKRLRKDK